MSRSTLGRVALVALLTTVPVHAAHAQLGKFIKKAAEGAVQGATQGAVQSAASTPARSTREEAIVAITPQNLDALLAALAPTVKAAQAHEARRARYEEQTARFERHRACRDS